jgi:hypothetical protein
MISDVDEDVIITGFVQSIEETQRPYLGVGA